MNDMLTPGSLPSKVVAHMLVSRGEFSPAEMAEAISEDESAVRAALGSLTELGKVVRRAEAGTLLYKLEDPAGMRVPGSARPPVSPLELRREPAATKSEPNRKPAPKKEKAADAPATPPWVKPGTERAQIYDWVKRNPGSTYKQVAAGLDLDAGRVQSQLAQLRNRGLLTSDGKGRAGEAFVWHAAGAPRADVSTPAEAAPKKPRAPARRAKPERDTRLHDLGAASPAPAAPDHLEAPALAIDADGVVAIETIKLSPRGIECLVAFLEASQLLWRRAA